MSGTRWLLVLLLAGLGAAGCADLPVIQENTCGNGLVEPGEDCDGKATADGKDCSASTDTCVCRQAGEVDECRYRCDTAADCPADGKGWGCGVDNVCRRPRLCKGAVCDRWTSAAFVPESPTQLTIADFDGSGRGSVLSVASPLVSVHSFDEAGRLLDSDVLVLPDASLAVGDLTSADPRNSTDLHPISDFVVDVSRGIEVFRGSSEAGVQPTVYSSITLAAMGRVHAFNFLDQTLRGPQVLFFPVGPDGKTTSVLGFDSASMPVLLASIGGGGGKLAGDAVIAPFFNAVFPAFPCEQFAATFENAKGVKVYTPCKTNGSYNVEGPDPSYVPPTNIALPGAATVHKGSQALFTVYADDDQTPDLLIIADDPQAGPASFFLAFSRGDGTFHSSPDKAPPADNKAVLVPVNTPLAQPEQAIKHLHDAPLAVGDLNADCAIDFVNGFGIYLSEVGKGTCFKPEYFFTLSFLDEEHLWTSAVVADFSADGLLDVIVGSQQTPGMTFYKGTGGPLLNPFKLVTQGGVKTFVTGDFDGDFVLDLAFTQTGDVNDDGTAYEFLSVVFGGITGGPSQPVLMGETQPVRQLVTTNVLSIYPDFITELLAISANDDNGLSVSLFPGNSGRLLQAPYYLLNPKSALPDFPSQVAIGQFDGDPHNDIAAFGRQLCFAEAECSPQLWLVPVTGEAEIAPGGDEGAPIPTALPLVKDGVSLEDIQAGALMASVDLGPASGAKTDEVVLVTAGKPCLLYVASSVSGAWAVAPKQELNELGNAKLRELGITVADLDGDGARDVIVSSRSGVLVLWNQGSGSLDAAKHSTFLTAADLSAAACEGAAGASAVVLGVGSIAADADDKRELLVSTGRATYLVEAVGKKLVPVCQQGIPGGNTVAGGDVNGDGVDDLVVGRKGGIELFLAEPAPAGPDLTVRQ